MSCSLGDRFGNPRSLRSLFPKAAIQSMNRSSCRNLLGGASLQERRWTDRSCRWSPLPPNLVRVSERDDILPKIALIPFRGTLTPVEQWPQPRFSTDTTIQNEALQPFRRSFSINGCPLARLHGHCVPAGVVHPPSSSLRIPSPHCPARAISFCPLCPPEGLEGALSARKSL